MEHVNTGMIQKVNKEKKAMNKIVFQTIRNTSFELLQFTGIEFYWISRNCSHFQSTSMEYKSMSYSLHTINLVII
jgi:hypothetical protein